MKACIALLVDNQIHNLSRKLIFSSSKGFIELILNNLELIEYFEVIISKKMYTGA